MSESTPTPKPKPVPHPIPRPRPVAAAIAKPAQAIDEAAAARAAAWGRVDGEGNVWLRSDEGERVVGQYAAGGSEEDALSLYVRRFLDLQAQISLLESRVEGISPDEATASLSSIEAQLVEPAVVGDVESLRSRAAALKATISARAQVIAAEREEARAAALAERTTLIERAEEIANTAPNKIHWRNSREELAQIFEQWKAAQRSGPRIDRTTEEALWQRYSKARSQFDKARRHHFGVLESERSEVMARKNALIERAEAMAESTEWGSTAAAYRALMDEWRQAGHAARKDDDKLWERFRGAQQRFFDARATHFAERDEEFSGNLAAKLELIKEAEAVLPVKDIEAARAALRDIEDKWDQIGMVPRADIGRTEGRLREIEEAVRDAEAEKWRRTDPAKQQRSSGMAEQLQQLISELDGQIEAAEAAGDQKALNELTSARQAREAWLAQVQKDL